MKKTTKQVLLPAKLKPLGRYIIVRFPISECRVEAYGGIHSGNQIKDRLEAACKSEPNAVWTVCELVADYACRMTVEQIKVNVG
ncbi:MAG: hypothetical protein WC869_01215 [Phycisphaerae bacterium]|jgi:hypothetical protein